MSSYLVYDAILQGHEAENDQAAIDYASGFVWGECPATEQNIAYANHIETVGGVGVYYCYGADHYFFTDESEEG